MLSNWEEIMQLTSPESWSPHAMCEATRIFTSALGDRLAQIFLQNVLLPAVRRDIKETKKLNYHLFAALKRAVYKPAAFYKGIILAIAQVMINMNKNRKAEIVRCTILLVLIS